MDIFDEIQIERKPDIFDTIRIDKRILKEISNSVKERLSKDLKVDIFDTIKIELPGLLKKYVQPEKKEIAVTNEIINAIRAEVMREFGNLPKPKPVEKVIERKVIQKQEIKIENPIDVESIKKEFDKKLEDAVKKAKKDAEDNYRVVIAPAQFPNLENNVGKFLTIENSIDGLRTKWSDAGLVDGTDVSVPNSYIYTKGIILKNSAGTYYLVGVDLNGALTTTEVTP